MQQELRQMRYFEFRNLECFPFLNDFRVACFFNVGNDPYYLQSFTHLRVCVKIPRKIQLDEIRSDFIKKVSAFKRIIFTLVGTFFSLLIVLDIMIWG